MTPTSANQPKAFFAGSFNPFTAGHASIVERAASIFGAVVVGIGVNSAKTPAADAEERCAAIAALYAADPRVTVLSYTGLTAEAARQCGATVLVRGLRNGSDFDSEQQLADLNRRQFGLETVFLPTLPELSSVSSSAVRELRSYGIEPSWMLP